MEIHRIENIGNPRFDRHTLIRHGAYEVENCCCSFVISDKTTAQVFFDNPAYLDEVIDEFRFYAGHISRFVVKTTI